MGEIIFRSKGKRPVSISLSDEEDEFISKQGNKSEFIRNLIKREMEEQEIEEAKEEPFKLPENYPLTEAEVTEIAECMVEYKAKSWDWKWDDKKAQEKTSIEHWGGTFRMEILHPEFFANSSAHEYWIAYKDKRDATLPQRLWEKLKSCCPVPLEDDDVYEESEEASEFFKPINLKAEEIMSKRFKEEYLTPIAGRWTLKEICQALSTKGKSLTPTEIAAELKEDYQTVYNKILPLIKDYWFVK